MRLFTTLLLVFSSAPAFAWIGPVCYPNSTREIRVFLSEIQGRSIRADNVVVNLEDDDGEIKLVSTTPKWGGVEYLFEHQFQLAPYQGMTGIVGVNFITPEGPGVLRYEFEFREGNCSGAVVTAY